MPKFIIHKDGKTTIKEGDNIIQRYTQILTQKPFQVIFALWTISLPFWLMHQSVFGKHHIIVSHFFLKLSCRLGPETRPITGSSIQWDEVLNLVILCIISLAPSVGNVDHSKPSSLSDKREPRIMR